MFIFLTKVSKNGQAHTCIINSLIFWQNIENTETRNTRTECVPDLSTVEGYLYR